MYPSMFLRTVIDSLLDDVGYTLAGDLVGGYRIQIISFYRSAVNRWMLRSILSSIAIKDVPAQRHYLWKVRQ